MLEIVTKFIQNLDNLSSVSEIVEALAIHLQKISNIELSYWRKNKKDEWTCKWTKEELFVSNSFKDYIQTHLSECVMLQTVKNLPMNDKIPVLLLIPLFFNHESQGVIVLTNIEMETENKNTQDENIITLLLVSMITPYLYILYQNQIKLSTTQSTKTNTKNQVIHEKFIHLKVLLVEDVTSYQIILSKFLQNLGIIPTISSTGTDALFQLQKNNFDLILLDLQLPDIDGITVAKKARQELNFTKPIIAMTADNEYSVLEKITHAGMNSIIVKPIQQSKLQEILLMYSPKTHQTPDLTFLEDAANNNIAFMKTVLKMTVTEFEQFEKLFIIALNNKNMNEITLLKHKIKPHIESYKLDIIRDVTEEIILEADNDEQKNALLAKLNSEIRYICDFFAKQSLQ
jgi:CheY-like chemotaxis protein